MRKLRYLKSLLIFSFFFLFHDWFVAEVRLRFADHNVSFFSKQRLRNKVFFITEHFNGECMAALTKGVLDYFDHNAGISPH